MLDSRQIYFVNQIVEYIVRNGIMKDLSVLQESPFTDQGSIVEIFTDVSVWMGIRKVIDTINANAAAQMVLASIDRKIYRKTGNKKKMYACAAYIFFYITLSVNYLTFTVYVPAPSPVRLESVVMLINSTLHFLLPVITIVSSFPDFLTLIVVSALVFISYTVVEQSAGSYTRKVTLSA